MGADGVVGVLPSVEITIELGDLERARGNLIELLRMGAVGALDPSRSVWASAAAGRRGGRRAGGRLLQRRRRTHFRRRPAGCAGEKASDVRASPETKLPPWKWRDDAPRSHPSARPRRAPGGGSQRGMYCPIPGCACSNLGRTSTLGYRGWTSSTGLPIGRERLEVCFNPRPKGQNTDNQETDYSPRLRGPVSS